jgi:hypothetical protein
VRVGLDEFQENRERKKADPGTDKKVAGCSDYDPPAVVKFSHDTMKIRGIPGPWRQMTENTPILHGNHIRQAVRSPLAPDEHLIERGFWVYDEFCRKGVLE